MHTVLSKTQKFLLNHIGTVIIALIYVLIAFFVIRVQEGFIIVNDEWSSFRQIESFQKGVYRLNGAKDTAFILQGILGFGFAQIFGDVSVGVRVLNVVNTVFVMFGLSLLFETLFRDKKLTRTLVIATIIFNPLVYFLSLTFYSEVYFVNAIIWALYLFAMHLKNNNYWILILSMLAAGSSVLVRQQGVFVPAVLLIYLLFVEKRKFTNLILPGLAAAIPVFGYLIWPRYISFDQEYFFSGLKLITSVGNGNYDVESHYKYKFIPIYLGLFLLPIIKLIKPRLIHIAFFSVLVGIVFWANVLPMGSVVNLEGIYGSSSLEYEVGAINNTYTKVLLAVLASIGIVYLTTWVENWKFTAKSLEDKIFWVTISTAFVMFISNFYISDVYDRYLTATIVLVGVALGITLLRNAGKFCLLNWGFLLVLGVVAVSLSQNYWNYKRALYSLPDLVNIKDYTRFRLDDAYEKYHHSKKVNDFTGLIYPHPTLKYKCYAKKVYFRETEVSKFVNKIDKNNPIPSWGARGNEIDGPFELSGEVVYSEPTRELLGFIPKLELWCRVENENSKNQ